jgi:glycosyltransferase involved in cell wall biosynthesis
LQYDLNRLGLADRVHFVGARPNPQDYLAVFDVFTLVSREDPFPLVSLEAASLGKPVVCFAGSGGAPEFVESDSGFVVPYLDLEGMADRCVELLRSPELRARLGQCAAAKVRQRHDVAVVGPQLAQLLRRLLQPVTAP